VSSSGPVSVYSDQAEQLQEYGLRRIIEDILIQEEEHKRDLLIVFK